MTLMSLTAQPWTQAGDHSLDMHNVHFRLAEDKDVEDTIDGERLSLRMETLYFSRQLILSD